MLNVPICYQILLKQSIVFPIELSSFNRKDGIRSPRTAKAEKLALTIAGSRLSFSGMIRLDYENKSIPALELLVNSIGLYKHEPVNIYKAHTPNTQYHANTNKDKLLNSLKINGHAAAGCRDLGQQR